MLHPEVQLGRPETCRMLYVRWAREQRHGSLFLNAVLARSCPHLGNWWLASVAAHPLWLRMLDFVSAHAREACRLAPNVGAYAVLELTGPFALYHARHAAHAPR